MITTNQFINYYEKIRRSLKNAQHSSKNILSRVLGQIIFNFLSFAINAGSYNAIIVGKYMQIYAPNSYMVMFVLYSVKLIT